MGQCLLVPPDVSKGGRITAKDANAPLDQSTFLALKPPVLLLRSYRSRSLVVEDDITQKTLDFRDEKGEIADARSLEEVTFQSAVRIGWKFLGVNAYL